MTATNEKPTHTNDEARAHVQRMLEDFDTVLVGTAEDETNAHLRVRPMAVARLEEGCRMVFVTSLDTEKVDEVLDHPRAGYVFAQSKMRYVSMRGHFTVRHDPVKLKAMWRKMFETWFEGPDDPKAVLMEFEPEDAEVWDNSGVNGVNYLFKAARALITGKKPLASDDQHERVDLH